MSTEKNIFIMNPDGRQLGITRVFDAPRELVFKVWTDPARIPHWWGPAYLKTIVEKMNVRLGGEWHFIQHSPDGKEHVFHGVFLEIVPPARLVQTFLYKGAPGHQAVVTVTFEEVDGKTRVTSATRFQTAGELDEFIDAGAKGGMGESMNRVEELLFQLQKNDAPSASSDREIVISRLLDAPRELVWQAMTSPQHIENWWGPRGFTTTIEKMDVRVGGEWKHLMRGPDGTEYPNESVFTEVVAPKRISFSHSGGRKGAPVVPFEATWTFDEPEPDKTKVTIRMVFPTAKDRDMIVREYGAIEGGKQTLARLGELMAKTPVIVERVLDAPIEMVWKALTDVGQMKQWYFTELESFKPEVGFETQVNVRHEGKDYLHFWKVTEVVPGKKIAYSWKYADYDGDSVVSFELFPEAAGTRLKLTHTGLETFHRETTPSLERGNFLKGWTHFANSLKEFLATKKSG
jgi:uncharacterized protein YndB with AHSA1/START domain